MPKHLDYDRALCKGMDTNLFYLDDETLIKNRSSLYSVRALCFSCPILYECMEYGFTYERYGLFGGITGEERDLLRKKDYNHIKIVKLLDDLALLEFSINEILPHVNKKTALYK